jgi:hypothetical protein
MSFSTSALSHKDHLWRWGDVAEQREQGKSRAAGHLHIEEDHIRLGLLNQVDGRLCAVGLADDFDAWMCGKAFRQVQARPWLIIHQHGAECAISSARIHGR